MPDALHNKLDFGYGPCSVAGLQVQNCLPFSALAISTTTGRLPVAAIAEVELPKRISFAV
jgi:hypothetical protein